MRRVLRPAALGVAVLVAGCGGDRMSAGVPKGCSAFVAATHAGLPSGFPQPEAGLLAGSVEQRGEQLEVQGFVARSPGDAARDLLAQPGVHGIDSEDDGLDAEASFTSGRYRFAFKFVEVCKGGSTFTAVRVREPGR